MRTKWAEVACELAPRKAPLATHVHFPDNHMVELASRLQYSLSIISFEINAYLYIIFN